MKTAQVNLPEKLANLPVICVYICSICRLSVGHAIADTITRQEQYKIPGEFTHSRRKNCEWIACTFIDAGRRNYRIREQAE